MSTRNTQRPVATIGTHIYEPIVIAELRRQGFACWEQRAILIPATHASRESLANAPKFQERCKGYVARGLYPVFDQTRRELVVYQPKKKRARRKTSKK